MSRHKGNQRGHFRACFRCASAHFKMSVIMAFGASFAIRLFMASMTYHDITRTAEEVGHGFDMLELPVAITDTAWAKYVLWDDSDTDAQGYQEQDGRLWDVVYVAGSTLQIRWNQFLRNGEHLFEVQIVPRDGQSEHAMRVFFRATVDDDAGFLILDAIRAESIQQDSEW